jgi:mannan endo-1,4-beta-mannosidase
MAAIVAAITMAVATVLIFTVQGLRGRAEAVLSSPSTPARASVQQNANGALSAAPGSYLGLYSDGVPDSYAGVTAFMKTTGVRPNLVSYYSGWYEPFKTAFAAAAAKNGAVPLVQLDPEGISVKAIASGSYDAYLTTYAQAVRAYHHPVVLSFGHEMNGYWYSWGYQNTPAPVFVAAWRHIVDLFRAQGVRNVTWLWTINIIHKRARVPSPGPWWPGSSYVNWVGIDGYYYNNSNTFANLFGPTITAVRLLTHAPILIAETAILPAANQPAKIDDLFDGIKLYGLLGFVWFDSVHVFDWRLSDAGAISMFRRQALAYQNSRS